MSAEALKREDAGIRQAEASDPARSVWVGASAGTGKTKVLIDRVLRLMLPRNSGEPATPPGKILCLTFTKTAAAEMSNRIYESLSKWSVMSDADLHAALENLIGVAPTDVVAQEARRLFARVLDTPGGLKIMTLHSFCQSVLKRFPIEAGLPPHFELMDEQDAVEYLTRCLRSISDETRDSPSAPLARAFNELALHLDEAAMSALMKEIMSKRSLLTEIFKHQGDAEGRAEKTISALYRHLHLDEKATEDDVIARACQTPHGEELKKALRVLLNGSKADQGKADYMQPWLEQPEHRAELFNTYCRAFFTQAGEIAKKMATNATVEAYPDILNVMQREAERLDGFLKKLRAVRLAKINSALLTVASAMVGRYTQYKRFRDRLDFDDLIIKACELLSAENMVPWVLYKLDEGIDHILVDEAQDTSRNQWRVVQALSDEFFAGRGAHEDVLRTLFVVGDEKQSIFSFQGADPDEFARMQAFFGERVLEIQTGWEVFLEYSFRSTRAVLEVVDGVFKDTAARKGVAERDVLHLPWRKGQAGVVELWPLIKAEKKEDGQAWRMPVDIDAGDNAAARLAEKIATTIKGWIDAKETLPARSRPIRAGDILILVQSRNAIVQWLMRALKSHDVPVAGVDRMMLTQEIAVMDLLALAHFALLPSDDLTLAGLMKSPLVGLAEEELFDLSYARSGSLWDSVRKKKPELAAWLQGWVGKAGTATPYAFFAEVLGTPCFADKISGRRAFYGRLGYDIQDALDEFLNSCLHYEQSHTPSLQKFTDWFARGETEIKREQDPGKADQVRIMTVHASKGLQAPIVFLPDTVRRPEDSPKGRINMIWPEDEKDVLLWAPRREFHDPVFSERRAGALAKQDEEYRRLLYVALTRAEDRLYVCGFLGKRMKEARPDCWYSLVEAAFPESATDASAGDDAEIRRIEYGQEVAPMIMHAAKNAEADGDAARAPLPDWVGRALPEEPQPVQPLAPSRPDDDEPAVKGPLTADDGGRFGRGIIVHRILEILPQLPAEKWEKTIRQYLARPALEMPVAVRESLAAEILAVLRHQEFARIFGAGSRAEVPVVGLKGSKILSGQMDRMCVTNDEVLIIDYKTNRPPPQKAEDVPVIYLKQMAAYRSVIQNIYPRHAIKCALLWTDGPLLMPLAANLLDRYAL